MAYLTAAELETAIGTTRLREIADPDNTGGVDAVKVGEALKAAQSKIDRYVGKKREVPLADPVPELIRQLMIDLTVYALKQRGRNMVTVEDIEAEAINVKTLDDIASGKITLGTTVEPKAAAMVVDKAGPRDSTKTASRKALEGGW